MKIIVHSTTVQWTCEVCGIESGTVTFPFHFHEYADERIGREECDKIDSAQASFGFEDVTLYGGRNIMCCGSCAEVMKSRRLVEVSPGEDEEVPY